MIKRKLAIIAICMLIFTSFCGCEKMITLTDEEEEEIGIYVSSLIGKYNRNQQKGLSYISKERQRELLEGGSPEEEAAPEMPPEPVIDSSESIDPETGFIIEPDTGILIDPVTLAEFDQTTHQPILDEEGNQVYAEPREPVSEDDGEEADTATVGSETNMAEIIPVDGASFTYDGAKMTTHYGTEYYDLSPTRGYEFLEISFTLKNTSDQSIDVDTTQYGLAFKATVDGVTAKSDQTILINDLKSFVGTVPAGESVDLVLLFQYPAGRITDLNDLSLTAEYGGNTYPVSL